VRFKRLKIKLLRLIYAIDKAFADARETQRRIDEARHEVEAKHGYLRRHY
jgi:hypothetical protein